MESMPPVLYRELESDSPFNLSLSIHASTHSSLHVRPSGFFPTARSIVITSLKPPVFTFFTFSAKIALSLIHI